MTKTYILDASVVVAFYNRNDRQHRVVCEWFESLSGEDVQTGPSLLLTELAAAFSQCNLSKAVLERALAITKSTFEFLDLTTDRSAQAGELAYRSGSRGADAVYIQAALETYGVLVTSDRRQAQAAKRVDAGTILLRAPE
jgi:predicted nucleic acid-binding protein